MGKIICNGVAINYRSVGKGSDVILIHGLATNHAFWRFEVLFSLAKDFRVTVFDLRGHGYSDMPPSGYTSADMAEDLHCLLNHLNISQAHLIGHSFGGLIALHYATLYPDRVVSLTIADSRVRVLQPYQRLTDLPDWKEKKKRLKEVGLFISNDQTDIGLYLLEKLALHEWQQKIPKKNGNSESLPFHGLRWGKRSAERWLELLRTTSIRQDLTSLAGLTIDKLSIIYHPCLLIYGEKSLVMQSYQGLRDILPNCKTVIVSEAGHFFPRTRPKLFIETVKHFFESVDLNNGIIERNLKTLKM